jgi:hypothetical protein
MATSSRGKVQSNRQTTKKSSSKARPRDNEDEDDDSDDDDDVEDTRPSSKKKKKVSKESYRARTVTTPRFRLSYPALGKPEASMGDESKKRYSLQGILDEKEDLAGMNKAILNAKKEFFGDKADWPKNLLSPMRDGNKDRPDDEAYADATFFSANSKNKPGLVLRKKSKKTGAYISLARDTSADEIEDIFYPGCYCRAVLLAEGFDYMGKKGVKFYLQSVQKLEDGERLGGRGDAALDYEDDLDNNEADDEADDAEESDKEFDDDDAEVDDDEEEEDERPVKKKAKVAVKKTAKKKRPVDEDEDADDEDD